MLCLDDGACRTRRARHCTKQFSMVREFRRRRRHQLRLFQLRTVHGDGSWFGRLLQRERHVCGPEKPLDRTPRRRRSARPASTTARIRDCGATAATRQKQEKAMKISFSVLSLLLATIALAPTAHVQNYPWCARYGTPYSD